MEQLIRRGRPSYAITANMNYAMLSAADVGLQAANLGAAFIVADGMPLVWMSRLKGRPLPERVTGADLVPALCERAAEKGFRVLLLGGSPGVAETAKKRLQDQFPLLRMKSMEAPKFRGLSGAANERMIAGVKAERPDLLLLACAQPEGELWLASHCKELGVPVCVQIGAAVDFAAGTIARAPRLVQKIGLEWLYRLGREPRRLANRYFRNARFLAFTRP